MAFRSPPVSLVREHLAVYRYMLPRLRALLSIFPTAQPTSWYRDRATNVRVGGAARSQHLLGFAVDFDLPDRAEYARFARWSQALGLVAVVESDHVHTQVFRAGTIPRSVFIEV